MKTGRLKKARKLSPALNNNLSPGVKFDIMINQQFFLFGASGTTLDSQIITNPFMKSLATKLIFLLATAGYGQQDYVENNFPTENGLIRYSEVVKVDSSLKADDLYLNAKVWTARGFKSGKAVIETDDKARGLIIIKSFIAKGHNAQIKNPKKWFMLKLEIKDGRYRYTLDDVRYEFDISFVNPISGAPYHEHIDKPFEEWVMTPSEVKYSEKKRKEVEAGVNDYCKELNTAFVAIINEMKESMKKAQEDDW